MKSQYRIVLAMLLFVAFLGGCSTENPDAVYGGHPDDWVCNHSVEALLDPTACTSCHGSDYNGSGNVPGCFDCHLGSAPTFSVHPDTWTNALVDHLPFAFDDSWTTCSVADCHGGDLRGGSNPFCSTGPSCFICHDPPPPPHRTSYVAAADHGPDAKNFFSDGQGQFYCRNCHGLPMNNFDGGYVTTAILGQPVANGACSAGLCHPDAKAHYTNWQGDNDSGPTDQDPGYHSTHRTVDQVTVDRSCNLCHKTTSVGAGPMPGAPSCFSTGFTNANNIASTCHPSGPGVAPHATDGTYRDPDNHGPDAKTNLGLDFCKGCHARSVPVNNYRFDVAIGLLLNGCENCHAVNAAHPPATLVLPSQDRWTFRGDPAVAPRRTHFAAAAPLTNCTLCHGVNLDGIGGTGPTCYTCHDPAVTAPTFSLQCTFCHGSPPDGSADLTGSPTPVDHFLPGGDVSAIADHDACATCHGTKDDGNGRLTARNGNYILFDRTNAPQGGDHLDGQIEMNGPTASNTGAAYDFANQGCDLACHSNDFAHQMDRNSGLDITYGDYGGGSGVSGCDSCHAYPPDGTPDLTTATPVNHLFGDNGITLLANHNECQLCHGTRDDSFGGHDPATNYNPATDHNTNPHQINMNINFDYVSNTVDPLFGGCNSACHLNNGTHRFPNSSDLTIVEGDYGSASCASCHDDVTSGAPIVRFGDPHAGVICESCHPGGNRGALHSDSDGAGGVDVNVVLIANNPTVGIDYTANGETGIYLGGNDTIGTTEAEICWNCHDSVGKSEWGTNTGTGSSYNYGTLVNPGTATTRSNWIGAEWNSGVAKFDYKDGNIQSTHAANASGISGVDLVEDIRCSYCHDVHDLNLAPGDNVSNAPYLRGTWLGNPYREDGAPQANDSWTTGNFGAVPRGTLDSIELGGYQIDQNNSFPTSGWTADDSSSLCELCHGTGDGTWDVLTIDGNGDNEIDRINQFGSPSTDWVGTNGHSNAALGGTGNLASNIFRVADRNVNPPAFTDANATADQATNPAMAQQQIALGTRNRAFSFRSASSEPDGWNLAPRIVVDRVLDEYEWGADTNSLLEIGYHQFSCSKCHNPHASRLPRLMITNCLDTKHNDWDDQASVDVIPPEGTDTPTNEVDYTINAENADVTFSNTTSAQNCHRVKDPAFTNSRGTGWNNVTPW